MQLACIDSIQPAEIVKQLEAHDPLKNGVQEIESRHLIQLCKFQSTIIDSG